MKFYNYSDSIVTTTVFQTILNYLRSNKTDNLKISNQEANIFRSGIISGRRIKKNSKKTLEKSWTKDSSSVFSKKNNKTDNYNTSINKIN